ncbi:MAG: PEP-utilizing enzyme [Candidatus Micrarchaeota archaeon]
MEIPVFKEVYVQSGNVAALNSYPWIVAMGSPTWEVFGGKLTPLCAFFRKNYAYIYYEKSNFDQLAGKALVKIQDGQIYKKWKKNCSELFEISACIDKKPASNSQKGFTLVFDKMVEFWKWSVFIDSFDTGTDFREIDKIAKGYDFTREETQVLTTPDELSYLQDFELQLLKAQRDQSYAKLLANYFWINTNYSEWGKFTASGAKQLAEQKRVSINLDSAIRSLENYSAQIKQKQQGILAKKNLEKNPFETFVLLAAWRDERKKFNYVGLHALGFYAREILIANKTDPKFYNVLTPEECAAAQLPSLNELRARVKNGILVTGFDDHYGVVTDKIASQIFNELESKRLSNRFDLRGQSACLGRVTGKVFIVENVSQLAAFPEGAVLVTGMTRPEFVPAMKKCIGIITDEGGITCHAAIVSRELNKPCIVGTQIATKRLKTGDVVELDAFHGLVKKVS